MCVRAPNPPIWLAGGFISRGKKQHDFFIHLRVQRLQSVGGHHAEARGRGGADEAQ